MIDGPYIFERDILGGLKGGKGTFFLNVSFHHSSIFPLCPRRELMTRVRIMIVSIIMWMMSDIWIHSMSPPTLYPSPSFIHGLLTLVHEVLRIVHDPSRQEADHQGTYYRIPYLVTCGYDYPIL